MRKILSLALALAVCMMLAGCGHTHVWKDADCMAPKTCTECGQTEGEPGDHKWVEASCTEPKHCEVCGQTEGQPLEHQWTEATVENPKTCSRCGLTEGEPLPDTYFTRNGLKFEELQDFELPFAAAFVDDADENVVEIDGMWIETEMAKYTFGEITSEPSEQEGEIVVTIPYTTTYSVTCYADTTKSNGVSRVGHVTATLGVGDSYTGDIVMCRAAIGNDTVESIIGFEWDENTYYISMKKDVNTEESVSDWKKYNGTVYKCTHNYEDKAVLTITIPEDYDGAVLYIERDGATEVNLDQIYEDVKGKNEHFLDEHDADYYMFFRLSDLIQ